MNVHVHVWPCSATTTDSVIVVEKSAPTILFIGAGVGLPDIVFLYHCTLSHALDLVCVLMYIYTHLTCWL